MLQMLKEALDKQDVFNGKILPLLERLIDTIPVDTIPYRMKLTLAVSELMLYVSHLRRNIDHWNGSSIPINSITFCIAKSGASKDSSIKAVRKCFKEGYSIIEEQRKEFAKEKAIQLAKEDKKQDASKWSVYKDYYISPNPLFVAPSTVEGFIQHLNDIEESGIGGGFIYSGEVGSELANSSILVENIKLLSELYDEGTKEVKVLKSRENQSKEISGLPVSALLVGSQDNILLDESIKKRFKTEFSSKLARRTFFNYSMEDIKPVVYKSVEDMLAAEIAAESKALEARKEISDYIVEVTNYHEDVIGEPVGVTDEVRDLFMLYKRYNAEVAEGITNQYPIAKLTRTHLQWKALKLAGAIAVISGQNEVTLEDYIYAINFVELLDEDMVKFETELIKEPYEMFCSYMKSIEEDGKAYIGLHMLRKLGYIPMKGTPSTKMKELVHLATSYDPEAVYTLAEEGIHYSKQILTDKLTMSCVVAEGTKDQRKKQCATGYEVYELEFADLSDMLEQDLAYTPFKFDKGIRGKDHIYGGCKWVVLDIDTSGITDEEAHFLLSDINHHIARTSDPDNAFKFRVLLELDAEVDIESRQWRFFINDIANELGLKADLLPKSSIYFSFSGRNILSVTDQEPVETRTFIVSSAEKVLENNNSSNKQYTARQKSVLLDDPMTTFAPAYEAVSGEGSRKMIWAARYAMELGADKSYILDLVKEINDYWVVPLKEERFQNTIISQIERW